MTTTIQAYRRNKEVSQVAAGIKLVFKPNASGDVVCDVFDKSAVDWLLGESSAFRLYGAQARASVSAVLTEPVAEPPLPPESDEASPYVIKDADGAVVLDLRPMADDVLHEFCKVNGITVHHACKGDTIRDKIVEFLKSEG